MINSFVVTTACVILAFCWTAHGQNATRAPSATPANSTTPAPTTQAPAATTRSPSTVTEELQFTFALNVSYTRFNRSDFVSAIAAAVDIANLTRVMVAAVLNSTPSPMVAVNQTAAPTPAPRPNTVETHVVFHFGAPANASTEVSAVTLSARLLLILTRGEEDPAFALYLAPLRLLRYSYEVLTTGTSGPTVTYTPLPTILFFGVNGGTPPPERVGEEEGNSGYIIAVVFGVIGVIILIGGITFCVKKFVLREKDVRTGGRSYKHARAVP